MKKLLVTTALLGVPLFAHAQPVSGLYVAAGAGVNLMQTEYYKGSTHDDAFKPVGFLNTIPASNSTYNEKSHFDAGGVAVTSVGFGLGNGLRFEIEGDYRYNSENNGVYRTGRALREQKFGGMGNALFDLDIGSPYIFPYGGLGAGYMRTDRAYGGKQQGAFAYQAIAGLAVPIRWVPGLSVTLEYRFMGLLDTKETETHAAGPFNGAETQSEHYDTDLNHSVLIGLRYAFGVAAPASTYVPPPVLPSLPAAARTYLLFFDWDRADLTERAKQIIAEAASASTRVQTTRIDVQGNADRSGTPAYNQGLSLRRAQTVAAELVRHGVPRTEIDIQAFGDTRPLVPTAAGVREPQNRRVAIILH